MEDIQMKVFLKHSNYLYFVVAILSLITYFIRKDMNNTFWLVMFFAWSCFGFTSMARKKDKDKNNENI